MDINLTQKVHDILTAPDHLWYNRLDWHKRTCARHQVPELLPWLMMICAHYCMIEYYHEHNPTLATIWFEHESDATQWDLTL